MTRSRLRGALLGLGLFLAPIVAFAYAEFNMQAGTFGCPSSGGAACTVNGMVMMFLNGSNQPQGVAASTPLPVTSVPQAVTPVAASTALESNHVLKGSAGTFYGAQVNTTTVAGWVMLFDATVLPSNGAVTPLAAWQVPANATLSIAESPGLTLQNGCVIAFSSTGQFTLTASATAGFAAGAVQ